MCIEKSTKKARNMPALYKVCLLDYPVEGDRDTICVRPYLKHFKHFKAEIFKRFPGLREAGLNMYYEGMCSHFVVIFFVPFLLRFYLFYCIVP